MVRYDKEEIQFYAVVPKNSTDMCYSIIKSKEIISKQFGFHFV